MKTFIIEENFTGYANIRIEAETEEESMSLYNRGHYKDSEYDRYNFCRDHFLIVCNIIIKWLMNSF